MAEVYHPRPYQNIATSFIIDHPQCMLAVDMGMGKTASTLAALEILKLAGSAYFPALVLGPTQVARTVWTSERARWERFEGLKIERIVGSKEQRLAALKRPRADIYVMNYENLPWLVALLEKKWPFRIVVADESTRLKNYRLVKGGVRSHALGKVAKHTQRWINLTGTLAPNGLTDLWGQYWFLDFGKRLGRTYTSFMQRWFYQNEYTREVTMLPGAEQEIHAAIADITLALRVEDWFDVQKPQLIRKEVQLPDAAYKQYRAMEKDFFAEIGDGIEAATSGVKSQKLLQMASGSIYDAAHTAHPVHDAKVEGLQEIVEEVREPLLVAYWYAFDLPRIQKAFPKARVRRSEKDDDDWNAGKIDMLLAHPASAGHGLNFQHGGRNIVFYSETWDTELRDQIIQRIGPARQAQSGYNRVVRIFDIVAKDTIDQEVLERNQTKESIQSALKRARARRPV